MIIEVSCVIGTVAIIVLMIKEKDPNYIIGFLLGFLIGFSVEPQGIAGKLWSYQNIAEPLNYPIFGVPISICLLYASIAASIVFLNKRFAGLREKYKGKLDSYIGYASTAAGVALFLLAYRLGISVSIGFAFIMGGLYLFVKSPVIFYVGLTGLASDLFFERLFILNKQMSYSASYGSVGVAFFLVGAIFSALFILINKHLPVKKSPKK